MENKIVFLKVHEAVKLEGNLCTHFSNAEIRGKIKADMQLIPELMSVQISGSQDTILVPLVNIAYLQLETSYVNDKRKEAAGNADLKPKQSLKPEEVRRPAKLRNG